MLNRTKQEMLDHAETLPASYERAQCYSIASLKIGQHETIASALEAQHHGIAGLLRAAELMKRAGCATEEPRKPGLFGTFTFEDGSKLN